jgi:NAD(P)-dependent dehydrogenase (short-subunit alcohol dehydrogenase family)
MELLPLLQATVVIRKAPSRLTIVGSYSQKRHTLEPVLSAGASVIDYLDGPSNFDKYKQYPNTKVLVNAFIKHLATIVPTDEVIMNVLCPGVVDTNIFRNFPVLLSVFMFIWRKTFARSVEEGGRASVYAMRVAGKESHGQFLSHNEITRYVLHYSCGVS